MPEFRRGDRVGVSSQYPDPMGWLFGSVVRWGPGQPGWSGRWLEVLLDGEAGPRVIPHFRVIPEAEARAADAESRLTRE